MGLCSFSRDLLELLRVAFGFLWLFLAFVLFCCPFGGYFRFPCWLFKIICFFCVFEMFLVFFGRANKKPNHPQLTSWKTGRGTNEVRGTRKGHVDLLTDTEKHGHPNSAHLTPTLLENGLCGGSGRRRLLGKGKALQTRS